MKSNAHGCTHARIHVQSKAKQSKEVQRGTRRQRPAAHNTNKHTRCAGTHREKRWTHTKEGHNRVRDEMKGTKSVREFEDEDERKRINVIRNERKKIENTTNFGTVALVLCSALLGCCRCCCCYYYYILNHLILLVFYLHWHWHALTTPSYGFGVWQLSEIRICAHTNTHRSE